MKMFLLKYSAWNQLIRYGVIGVFNNLIGYLVYLLVTFFWLEPKTTISILYPIAALMAYFGHMKYSFSYQGKHVGSLLRYTLAHFMGYTINFLMLLVLYERFQLPHQIVQAIAIPILALFLFFMMKYFVFPASVNRILE